MSWPAPEVTARRARPSEIPAGARRVMAVAIAAGWVVVATYARGTRVAGRGVPGAVVDSLALRMRRGGWCAVAVWTDGRFDLAYTWSAVTPYGKHNATTLRAALSEVTA